jgi:hypothetical protein
MQICIFECLKCYDECFLVNILSLKKTGGSGFINQMFQFYWFCLIKPDGPVLTDLAYVSSILFVVILLSCTSHNSCSPTQIVAHIECIHRRGALLNFLENCA